MATPQDDFEDSDFFSRGLRNARTTLTATFKSMPGPDASDLELKKWGREFCFDLVRPRPFSLHPLANISFVVGLRGRRGR